MIRTIVCVSILLGACTPCRAAEHDWQVGAARVAITPGEPMWMGGYAARKTPAEGTLAELYAKALAFRVGDRRMVIVTTDLISIPRTLADHVSQQVADKYDLTRAALLLNASHTHCGPELRPERDYFYGMAAEHAAQINAYTEVLEAALIDLIGDALADMQPARVTFARSTAEFAKNRRHPTEKGYINKRYDDGPTDHDVPVLQVFSLQGERRAILFGYACHNTSTGIMQFNGDYAGFAQADIEADFPGVTALFVQGTGGDQNPYPRGQIELARQHGRALADAVKQAVEAKQQSVAAKLDSALTAAELQFQQLPPREAIAADAESNNVFRRRKAKYLLAKLEQNEPIDPTYPCPVQAVRLGDEILLIAVGGEVVVDYSKLIKQTFPDVPFVWVAGYSNDVFGYLPSLRVLREGGYEAGGAMLYGPLPGPFTETVEQRIMQGVRQVGAEVGFAPQPADTHPEN